MKSNLTQSVGERMNQNVLVVESSSSMIGSQQIGDVNKVEKTRLQKKLSIQNLDKSPHPIDDSNKSQHTKSEILVSAVNNSHFSVTTNIQPHGTKTKTKSMTSQPQIVRHKIYQIKPMEMPTSSSQSHTSSMINNVSKELLNYNANKELTKKQVDNINSKQDKIKDKEVKAISNVFGQFFKVENLRHYTRPAQSDKVKAQQKSQQQKQQTVQKKNETVLPNAQTRIIYEPKIIRSTTEIRSIKSLSQRVQKIENIQKVEQNNKEQSIKPIEIKTPVKKEKIEQSKQLQVGQYLAKVIQNSFIKGQIENDNKTVQTQQIMLDEQILNVGNNTKSQFVKQQQQKRYSQPEFKMLQIDQLEQNILVNNKDIHKPITTPKIDQTKNQPSYELKEFLNNNQFTHPLLQCDSRESFPFIEPKQTLSQNATITNLHLSYQNQQFMDRSNNDNNNIDESNKKNKNQIRLKSMHSLGNLQPLLIKSNTKQSNIQQEEQQNVYTPFFQHKIIINKGEQSVDNMTQRSLPISNQLVKKEQVIIAEDNRNEGSLIIPVKDNIVQRDNTLLIHQIQTDIQNNTFIKSNIQTKPIIQPLYHELDFESVQQISNRLINQRQRQQQTGFVNDIVCVKQSKWRQLLIFNKNDVCTVNVYNNKNEVQPNEYVNQQLLFSFSPNTGVENQQYQCQKIKQDRKTQIKQPKPTQACSPNKYANYYMEIQNNIEQQLQQQKQSILIRNKTPLKLPTFNNNNNNKHNNNNNHLINQYTHIEQDTMNINELQSFYQQQKTPTNQVDTLLLLPLQSAQKKKNPLQHYNHHYNQADKQLPLQSSQSPFIRTNQSLTIDQQPSSILQPSSSLVENNQNHHERNNLQQIQQIRQFYNYLRSREIDYYGESNDNDQNNINNSPYHHYGNDLAKVYEKQQNNDTQQKQLYQQWSQQRSNNNNNNNKMMMYQNNKMMMYQNVHQIKGTAKPFINNVQSARSQYTYTCVNHNMYNNNNDKESQLVVENNPHHISNPINNNNTNNTSFYSKQKKSLQSVVLSFRRSNYIGDHQNFKDEVISLSQSHLNNQHSDPHVSFIEQPKEKIGFIQNIQNNQKNLFSIINKTNHQSIVDQKQKRSQDKVVMKDLAFPIEKIQPIKVLSKNKNRKGNKSLSKNKKNDNSITATTSLKKIKLVSVNFAQQQQSKPVQQQQQQSQYMVKLQQKHMSSSFLFNNPSHIGSFMLNNVIKSYIVNPLNPLVNNNKNDNKNNNNNQQHLKGIKQSSTLQSKITKQQQKIGQPTSSIKQKKKVPIKKDNLSQIKSTKKLSINQKLILNNNQKQKNDEENNNIITRQQSQQHQSQHNYYYKQTKYQSQHNNKNNLTTQLLKQSIQRIHQNKQKQLHKLIKSRIAQRQRQNSSRKSSSFNISSNYYKSPQKINVNTQSLLKEGQSNQSPLLKSTFNQFRQFRCEKQTYTSRMNNNNKRLLSSSNKRLLSSQNKRLLSSSNKICRHSSQQSSTHKRKSGLQLWNSGLSQLKTSRKSNKNSHSKQMRIFVTTNRQQQQLQNSRRKNKDEKILGITRWNQNISIYKQSRSKSNQNSHKSSINKSNSKSKQNTITSSYSFKNNQTGKNNQIGKNNNNNNNSYQNNSNQLQQKTMNIQIKKYKYQVMNIQKRYL